MVSGALTVVLFGTPRFALPTLERVLRSAHRLAGVVTQPDRPGGRGQRLQEPPVKEAAGARGIPVRQPERLKQEAFLAWLRGLDADIGVVAAYGRMLPDAVLQAPRLGMINVHASLLPKYRGAAPVHRAIMAGESITGVTIMQVVRELDAGPMLSTAERPIDPDETSVDVERDLAELGADLLVRTLDDLAAGRVREVQQDPAAATYAPKITREDGLIDWDRPARAIHDQVRALHPWPHAHSFLEGVRYLVLRSRVVDRAKAPVEAAPGTVVEARGDTLRVATGAGTAIDLLELQPEGRRPLAARQFLSCYRLAAGRRFDGP
jgi:methionyl-tRNA formyltransferase